MQKKFTKMLLSVLFIMLLWGGVRAATVYASDVLYYENGLRFGLLYDESGKETGNVEVGYPDCEYGRGYGCEPNIVVPESVEIRGVKYKVSRVEDYGFYRLSGLESISLPSSVTEIGECAFSECFDLASITAANEDIEVSVDAFNDTAWLNSQKDDFVILNNNLLKYQGKSANITIPSGIKKIGSGAFLDNDKIKSVTMPDTVEKIGDAAFYNCDNLNKVTLSNNLEYIGAIAFDSTNITSVKFPDSLKVIDDKAFWACNLTDLKLNNGLKEIGVEAFYATPIKKVTIPKTVDSIHELAFGYCEALTSVTISNGVKRIDKYAFQDCKNLSKVVIPSSVNYIGHSAFNNTKWEKKLTNEFCIINNMLVKYNGKSKTVKIPKGVKKILCTFEKDVEKVIFPSSLVEIGDFAFNECSINEITIPGHVKTIGIGAFADCVIKKLTIDNGVTIIGDYAFSGNKLTSVTIPKSVVKIGNHAFEENKDLSNVKFEEGKLEYIGELAFNTCNIHNFNPPSTVRYMGHTLLEFNNNLKSISYPKSMNSTSRTYWETEFKNVTKIIIPNGIKAVAYLTRYPKLKTLTLPDTLISINPLTFDESNIETIYIPEGTNYIGYKAFTDCKKLKEVSIPDSVKFISRGAFEGSDKVVIRCNENSVAYLFAQDVGIEVVGPYVKK